MSFWSGWTCDYQQLIKFWWCFGDAVHKFLNRIFAITGRGNYKYFASNSINNEYNA